MVLPVSFSTVHIFALLCEAELIVWFAGLAATDPAGQCQLRIQGLFARGLGRLGTG